MKLPGANGMYITIIKETPFKNREILMILGQWGRRKKHASFVQVQEEVLGTGTCSDSIDSW